MRLNERTAAELSQRRLDRARVDAMPLPLPHDAISIHVRHGDKHKEMALRSWSEYLQRAEDVVVARNVSTKTLFLSTEDPQVVEEAQHNEDWNVLVLPYNRTNGDFEGINAEGVSCCVVARGVHFFCTCAEQCCIRP
jgi:hypothetical protein